MSKATISSKAVSTFLTWTEEDDKAYDHAPMFRDPSDELHQYIPHDVKRCSSMNNPVFYYLHGRVANKEWYEQFELYKVKGTPQLSKLLGIVEVQLDKVLLRHSDGKLYRGADLDFSFNCTEGTLFFNAITTSAFTWAKGNRIFIPERQLDLAKYIALYQAAQ